MPRTLRPSSQRLPYHFRPYDIVAALLAPLIALWIRSPDLLSMERDTTVFFYVAVAGLLGGIFLTLSRVSSMVSRYLTADDAIYIFKVCGSIVLLASTVTFSFTRLDQIPRSLPLLHFVALVTLIAGGRFIRSSMRRRKEFRANSSRAVNRDHIIIVGANRFAWHYIRLIDSFSLGAHRIVGILDHRPRYLGRSICGHSVVGMPSQLIKLLDEYAVHGVNVSRVVLAVQENDLPPVTMDLISSVCLERDISLQYLTEILGVAEEVETASPLWVIDHDKVAAIQARRIWKVKRAFDTMLVLCSSIVTVPLYVLTACAVMIDVGFPVVFWQQRMGLNGTPIHVYKFRTMRTPIGADGQLIDESDRISGCGKFLRASRLDEIPQLMNVLHGDMSIIGPRPLLPIDQPENQSVRLAVRPGISGWAQVCGGKLITAEEKDALDEWYINNTTLYLEVKIAFLTLITALRGDVRNESAIQAALSKKAPANAGVEGVPATQ